MGSLVDYAVNIASSKFDMQPVMHVARVKDEKEQCFAILVNSSH